MTIEEFLKSPDNNVRVSIGNTWLYWEYLNSLTNEGQWVVLDRPPYAKRNRTLYNGDNLDEALRMLERG
jgi:hypothetical protein